MVGLDRKKSDVIDSNSAWVSATFLMWTGQLTLRSFITASDAIGFVVEAEQIEFTADLVVLESKPQSF